MIKREVNPMNLFCYVFKSNNAFGRKLNCIFGKDINRGLILVFLLLFTGWTISAHICVLLNLNLKTLLVIAPFVILILIGLYFLLSKKKLLNVNNQNDLKVIKHNVNNGNIFNIKLAMLISLPVLLYWSWAVFWVISTVILLFSLLQYDTIGPEEFITDNIPFKKKDIAVVVLVMTIVIMLSYGVTRSDLDDSFYVAIAAFTSANPAHSILTTDPMLGEHVFPLIFPSYRFATFELLSGAVAYLLSIPAMDVYYIYLLPFWIISSVAAVFLLAKELIPRYWLSAGIVTFLLILLLGEMSRSPANFSFSRIFQGKAVFVSVVVPTIFYLTARLFSKRGNTTDLFLLACCQVTAIGLSNFGMLAAPIAGFGAIISNIPIALKEDLKKLYFSFTILFIPLPYLIDVVIHSQGSPIMADGTETARNVWVSVFGPHQQYLLGFLLLAGPLLAKDNITRWRLSVPVLLLFAIYLNPWLSEFISRYVTTPPVYWRVVWSFPILAFAAVSFCMIISEIFQRKPLGLARTLLFSMTLALTLYSLPFSTLRTGNIDSYAGFAKRKISPLDLAVAQKAISLDSDDGRLLAPEEIAGIISRFEQHPRLIYTRSMYLDMMRAYIAENEFATRSVLYKFVTSGEVDNNTRAALDTQNVSVIVANINIETTCFTDFLTLEKYRQYTSINGYSIWKKNR